MENLTHSLLGAVMAEVALPAGATPGQRRVFYVAGIVASNLPDADLLYTSIMPAPLGYLLHHRGHTHTVIGLAGLAVLFGIVAAIPSVRRATHGMRGRFWSVVGAGLAGHLFADSWNSYGVHPFYPIDNRWFYGDAIYILEPWLWMLLGVSVALNTKSRRGRLALAGLLIALPLAASAVGLIGRATLIPLAVAAASLVVGLRRQAPVRRAVTSLVAAMLFVVALFALEGVARGRALASGPSSSGNVSVDVVLSPNPANPLCWSALLIERDASGAELVMRHGRIALTPEGFPVNGCGARATIVWEQPVRQSLTELRRLAREDCRASAWFQFGRAPVVEGGQISDMRFGGTGRANFTSMTLETSPARACPAHVTRWGMPRADVLAAF